MVGAGTGVAIAELEAWVDASDMGANRTCWWVHEGGGLTLVFGPEYLRADGSSIQDGEGCGNCENEIKSGTQW